MVRILEISKLSRKENFERRSEDFRDSQTQ